MQITRNVTYENHLMPFFWQHGEDEETLRRYVEAIRTAGCEAFCVESRPHPDFCGDGWWHDMDILLDEASRRNMKVWILDDSHFPTGYANGAMEQADPALARRSIMLREIPCPERETDVRLKEKTLKKPIKVEAPSAISEIMMRMAVKKAGKFSDDRLYAVVAYGPNGEREDLTGRAVFHKPAGAWKIYAMTVSGNYGPHRNYINMMDKASCRVLIDAVYEPHWEHYQRFFGNTIAGFFSDEPELGNGILYAQHNLLGTKQDLPWSKPLEKRLQERLGEYFARDLPLLWENDFAPQRTQEFRRNYMEAVTELVQECFSYQIGDWCRAHGVEYIGHMIEDAGTHFCTGSGLGHYFRGLAGQDMAGIDDIGGQVLPQGENVRTPDSLGRVRNPEFYHYTLAKLGQSLACFDPKKQGRCMCEIFGNYGWSSGVYEQKYLADHFLVRGINYFVPHAFSPKKFPDPDCPPHFYAHGNNPQYRAFGQLCRYMNRVASFITGGKPVISVAIYYNAESEWAGRCQSIDEVARIIGEAGIDYLFLPMDDMERAGEFRYIIVPQADYAPQELAKVPNTVFLETLPGNYGSESVSDDRVVPAAALADFLISHGCRETEAVPFDSRLKVLHYVGRENLSLVVNEGTDTYRGILKLPAEGKHVGYDAWNQQFLALDDEIHLELDPRKSLIILFTEEEFKTVREPEYVRKEELTEFRRSVCKAADYPSFGEAKPVTLPDNVQREDKKFGGFIRYETHFTAKAGVPVLVELEDAAEAIEVFVNGHSAGIQITPGYRFDVSEYIEDGDNLLVIEQATTLGLANGGGMAAKMSGKPHAVTGLEHPVVLRFGAGTD